MKIKLFIVAIIFAFVSCSSGKLDVTKAKECAENCLKAIDKENYAAVTTDYYSTELSSAEPAEELTNKFKKLKEVTGAMQSFELKETVMKNEVGEEAQIILTYAVKHDRVATIEKITVIQEGGKYKIASHDIKNE